MGEMADFYVDQMQDAYGWSPVGTRKSGGNGRRSKLVCRHCGMRNLNWQQIKGSHWRLHNGREVHDCLTKPTTPEGFDEEPV